MTTGIFFLEVLLTRRLTTVLVCTALLGCSDSSTDRRFDRAGIRLAADSIPLDSCAKLDRLGRPQARVLQPGEFIPLAHPGAWTDVKHLALGAVSIEVPIATTLERTNSNFVAVLDFPTCRYFCAISVTLVHDSLDRSLDAYVTSCRAIDTLADPDAMRDRPGPPRGISVGPERGLLMEMPCGDCGAVDLVVKRGKTIHSTHLA